MINLTNVSKTTVFGNEATPCDGARKVLKRTMRKAVRHDGKRIITNELSMMEHEPIINQPVQQHVDSLDVFRFRASIGNIMNKLNNDMPFMSPGYVEIYDALVLIQKEKGII